MIEDCTRDFKPQLKRDLQEIFEADEVVFSSANPSRPKALFVELTEVHERLSRGKMIFRVRGIIGRLDEETAHTFGFLLGRALQAPYRLTRNFNFASRESAINLESVEGIFTQSTLDFTYKFSVDYDTPAGDTKDISITVIEEKK